MGRAWCMMALCGAMTLVSCESADRAADQRNLDVATPLPHDPTDQFELARWWTNGTRLLLLDESNYYAMYLGTNRYAAPIERGRWSKQSYAALTLEPYDTRQHERTRVSITRADGELTLLLPKLKPMVAIERPPTVIEDRLVGEWQGPVGVLRLHGNMSYSLRPRASANGQPPAIPGHEGAWSVTDRTIHLQPRGDVMDPWRLEVTQDGDAVSLAASQGVMSRRETP